MTNTDENGRVAIVTGASKGIGAAIAQMLGQAGYCVLLVARSNELLDEVAARCGTRARVFAGDLREPRTCEGAVRTALSGFGRVDFLVNCAGTTKAGDFFTLTPQDFFDGFALKFHAAVNLTRAAWPHLKASGSGHLLNIIGAMARTPKADYTIGGPVNSALLNFTKAMADRGIDDGVRVNGINPGPIETDRVLAWLERIGETERVDEAEAREILVKGQRISRIGTPDEVAATVRFLDSAEGAYFHGAILDLDGGLTKGI